MNRLGYLLIFCILISCGSIKKTETIESNESSLACFNKKQLNSCVDSAFQEKDQDKKIKLLEQGCNNNNLSCKLKEFYENPNSTNDFSSPCLEQKDPRACYALSLSYLRLQKKKESKQLLEEICQNNYLLGCLEGAKNSNEDEKIGFLEKSCQLKDRESCFNLGDYYQQKNDVVGSQKFFFEGCQLSEVKSCFASGLINYNLGEKNKAVTFFNETCQLGGKKGCYYLGLIFKENREDEASFASFEKGCELDFSNSCFQLGNEYALRGDRNLALKYYSYSCDIAGIPENREMKSDQLYNCSMAGHYIAEFFNPKLSVPFFKIACEFPFGNEDEQDISLNACGRYGHYAKEDKILNQTIEFQKGPCMSGSKKERAINYCYNLTCLYSLMEVTDEAVNYFKLALKKGYRNFNHVINDYELSNVIQKNEIQDLIKEYTQNN